MNHHVTVEASPPSEPLYHVAFCLCGRRSGQHHTAGGARADLEQIHAREASSMRCNATIEVGGETLTCVTHQETSVRPHATARADSFHSWSDNTPGATPHEDPTPTYWAAPDDGSSTWRVVSDEFWQAMFRAGEGGHPDPQGAAEAEARRLQCQHGGDESLHGAWVCDGCGVEVERDPSIISTAELDRDRYRKALERISACGGPSWSSGFAARVIDGGAA